MPDLPAMLHVSGRRCVVVGGGAVARRRVVSLLEAGALVTVVAPRIDAEFAALAVTSAITSAVTKLERPYQPGDLADAFLVVIATDDPAVNQRVADDARAAHVLVNRADDPQAGDLRIPAHAHHGPVTLAVNTNGVSAAAAATIRRELSAALDPDWPRLLEAVAPFRAALQSPAGEPDPARRLEMLRRLTDAEAMQTLKTQGLDALRERCRAICATP
ncbi:MAG: bifunctional precorrin-2 dehydrogenase/sirohydrochlorin ferrochelatase [Planctomycetota bacterium]|nr:bifunctional precorrin-2 dehydrogenase/sirohydrochlorin ferrochelatase [Planctomycetota bacterium]